MLVKDFALHIGSQSKGSGAPTAKQGSISINCIIKNKAGPKGEEGIGRKWSAYETRFRRLAHIILACWIILWLVDVAGTVTL